MGSLHEKNHKKTRDTATLRKQLADTPMGSVGSSEMVKEEEEEPRRRRRGEGSRSPSPGPPATPTLSSPCHEIENLIFKSQ